MIVLDTSFLVAYHNERDVHHAAASAIMNRLISGEWGAGLLLEYVFLEVVTVLMARRDLATALAVGAILLESREIEFLPCSDFFAETLGTFRTQGHANLSFTDAAILTAARRNRPGYVASFDTDFRAVDGISLVPNG